MNEPGSKLIAALFVERRVLSVSELTHHVKDLLEVEFSAVNVQGEISNYKRHQSGHWYFTLKDSEAQLRAVFFRQWNRLMRFEPQNGLEVRLRGRLSVYEPRGDYQLLVDTLEPVGVGMLQLAFEQQVRRLAAEGLFDEARKRKLPLLPRRIGIVTSPVGAVLHDMLQILLRRNPNLDVIVAPVRVQGNTAAGEIADAIRLINKFAKKAAVPVDVIIVGRGGGSMEDLWAFNEEHVARAIFASEIPVVSAVGHETDFTIADFVADLRAPTPSAAAEIVAAQASDLNQRVQLAQADLVRAIHHYLLKRRLELQACVESRGFTDITARVLKLSARRRELETRAADALTENLRAARLRLQEARRRLVAVDFRAASATRRIKLESLERRLAAAMRRNRDLHGHKLAVAAGKLDMLSPLSVLARGYVLVQDDLGHLVTRAAGLKQGDDLKLRFEDGEVDCRVSEAQPSRVGSPTGRKG